MKLTSEEKFAFLELAQYVAKLDGEYGPKEQEIIGEYCMEMGIENFEVDLSEFNLDETLMVFKTVQSQKIAMLALMVLVHIDDKYGIYEQKMVDKIARIFELSEDKMQLFSMWGKAGSALYEQALIFTEK